MKPLMIAVQILLLVVFYLGGTTVSAGDVFSQEEKEAISKYIDDTGMKHQNSVQNWKDAANYLKELYEKFDGTPLQVAKIAQIKEMAHIKTDTMKELEREFPERAVDSKSHLFQPFTTEEEEKIANYVYNGGMKQDNSQS